MSVEPEGREHEYLQDCESCEATEQSVASIYLMKQPIARVAKQRSNPHYFKNSKAIKNEKGGYHGRY